MAKQPSSRQIEMLLPIDGKHTTSIKTAKTIEAQPSSYGELIKSLRAKGLTRVAVKK